MATDPEHIGTLVIANWRLQAEVERLSEENASLRAMVDDAALDAAGEPPPPPAEPYTAPA